MTKILVTGGAGYIGSVLVPILLSHDYYVTVIDNFKYKQLSLALHCVDSKLTIINGDIRNNKLLKSLIKDSDIVIPLAAYVGAPLCNADPYNAEQINKNAIFDMVKLLSNKQILIMPTTNSAYGSGDKNNLCNEESELKPLSLYAKNKVEVENYIMQRENSISLRLATVFGLSPRMRLDLLVNDFTYRAVKDGYIVLFESGFKRNYIHIRDVAKAFMHSISNFETMKGDIFNVGLSSANISKLELCSLIAKYVKNFVIKEAEFSIDPDQRNYIVSNSKIEATGYKPQYSLDDGIKELIKGYQMISDNNYRNI
jgi:nucleoside-diphosphate-sugar epimerase